MMPIDPYQLLQVAASCEQEVIHAAYRALAQKYHPDRDPSRHAQHRMAQLNDAYRLVRDVVSRERHDRAVRNAAFAPLAASRGRGAAALGRRPGHGWSSGATRAGRSVTWRARTPTTCAGCRATPRGSAIEREIYGILGRLGATAA